MTDFIEIRIVGPQFSDPHLFIRWLSEKHKTRATVSTFRLHDRILELHIPPNIHVLSAAPAHFEPEPVYMHLLQRADAVLIMLNRIADLRRLNADVLRMVRPAVVALGIIPVVAANDPHGNSAKFPTVPASALLPEIDPSWTLLQTMIGPFEPQLRWSEGAAETWDAVLAAARNRTSSGGIGDGNI